MISFIWLLAGYLVAWKANEDLDAFQPGPPRLSDLMVFIVSFLTLLILDAGLALVVDTPPVPPPCPLPCVVAVPV